MLSSNMCFYTKYQTFTHVLFTSDFFVLIENEETFFSEK